MNVHHNVTCNLIELFLIYKVFCLPKMSEYASTVHRFLFLEDLEQRKHVWHVRGQITELFL
jgi:hypothetical protein